MALPIGAGASGNLKADMSDALPDRHGSAARSEAVLLAMAAGGAGTLFEPARIRILLFLIDREIPEPFGGPHFDFRPYDYGPFDGAAYDELETLSQCGKVHMADSADRRTYALTEAGLDRGRRGLVRLPNEVRQYLGELARWVLSLGFGRLLAAIYRRYPEMAMNSPALDAERRFPSSERRPHMSPFSEGLVSAFDMTGTFLTPLPSQTGFRRDAEALRADWSAVGDDLRAAMAEYATEEPESV